MRKVLIIANQFPPLGGSGVQRSVKFVKHLPKYGYKSVVFTRKVGKNSLIDNTLLKDIPKGTKIIRTKAFESFEAKGILKIPLKIFSKIIIPDSARLWAETSKKKIIKILKQEDIKLVYTTSAPYSAHLLGLYIKKKLPYIKWVADFRDEWTNNPYTLDNPYNKIRTNVEKKMEKKVLETADFLITNTRVMKENFLKISSKNKDNFFVIPNGYDEEDFLGLDFKKVKSQKFTIVYTGALYGRRKIDNFLNALKNLKQKKLIDEDKIEVKLIGNYNKNKLQQKIDNESLTKQVFIKGYLEHDKCVQEQLLADALLLIEGGGAGANAFYTGKIFEYMNTNTPVIAILPEGVAKELVIETGIGLVADTDNVAEIENVILNYYNAWKDNKLFFNPNYNIIRNYERKVLTGELAQIFDKSFL